jgi:hypothetical protein
MTKLSLVRTWAGTLSLFFATEVMLLAQFFAPEEIKTLCTDWLDGDNNWSSLTYPRRGRNCTHYSEAELERLHFVVTDVFAKSGYTSTEVPNVFPGPPAIRSNGTADSSITIGSPVKGLQFYPPVRGSPYQLPSEWVYHFTLHKVPKDKMEWMLEHLKKIEKTKFYSRFSTKNVDFPYSLPGDYFAQYARAYELSNPKDRALLYLTPWSNALTKDNLRRLWVECTIPVDKSWLPTGLPERSVVPLAFLTTDALYVVGMEVRRVKWAAATIDRFVGRVFDLSALKDVETAFEVIVSTLRIELTKSFIDPPIAATQVSTSLPRHSMRFERRFEESLPLRGLKGPYYELSTYTVSIWTGPKESFIGTAEGYLSDLQNPERSKHTREIPNQVFIHLAHALQISVGRSGDYSEPTQQQYSQYQKPVQAAITKALQATTLKLGGRWDGEMGVLSDVNSR